MFGKSQGGDALIVARETHEGTYRSGVNVHAATGLYHHVYDYIADVTPDGGGEVFRATFVELFQSDREYRPLAGDTARVKIHKGNEVEFDRNELADRAKAQHDADHSSFTALANAGPGATAATGAPAPTGDPAIDSINFRIMKAQQKGDDAAVATLSAELERVKAGGEPEPRTPAAAPASTEDPLDRLAKLAELHKQGVLTNEEFAAQKAKILG